MKIEAVAAAGSLPVFAAALATTAQARGEIDEVFDGYGLLTAMGAAKPPLTRELSSA